MQVIGRYALFDELARGGMASVHLGRLVGPAGFSRTVAIKRLHPHLAKDPEFVTMLLDEARLAGRIQHPNVVSTLDIVASDGELFIVMDYLHGETLSRLLRASSQADRRIPPNIAAAILIDTLHGLHAAHEVKGESGDLLGLVHRDFTPQNIMIRRDGTALVVDFGVAKAAGRFHTTEEGKIKGKLPYMAPEQVRAAGISRRTDIYAAGAVLWEALVGERLKKGASEAEVLEQLLFGTVEAPSSIVPEIPKALDDVVLRALERDPEKRFATADEMANAIEAAVEPARLAKVGAWMEELVGESLSAQAVKLAAVETYDSSNLSTPTVEAYSSTSRTKLEIARPGPTLSPSEIRRSMHDVDAAPSSKKKSSVSSDDAHTRVDASQVELITNASGSAVISKREAPAKAQGSWKTSVLWVALIALATVGGFFLFRGLGTRDPRTALAPTSLGTANGVNVSPTSPSVTGPEATASSAPIASSLPAPLVSAVPSATSSATPIGPHGPRGPVHPPPTAAPNTNCAIPYVVDDSGKRHYKRECL